MASELELRRRRAKAKMAIRSQPAEEEAGFLERSGNTLLEGFSDAGSSLAGWRDPAGNVQKALGGDILPAVGSVVGDAVMTVGKEVLPQSWQESIKGAAEYVGESAPVQAVGRGLESWREASPDTFDRAGELANFAGLLPKTPKVSFADDVAANRTAALVKQKRADTMKLLEPDVISARDLEVSPILKRYERQAKEWETRIYDEVEKVDGFDPRGNNVENVHALDAETTKIKDQLDADLADVERFDVEDILGDDGLIAKQIAELELEPLLVGDAGESAKRIYNIFKRDIRNSIDADGKISALEVLQARRDMDAALRKASAGIFDPSTSSANKVATRRIRQSINDLVADKAPDANVREALTRQSDLLTAADDIDKIVSTEARTGLGRAVQKVEESSGLKPARTPGGAVFNLSSIPAVALGTAATGLTLGGRGLKNAAGAGSAAGKTVLQKAINSLGSPAAKGLTLAALQNEKEDIQIPYRR